MIRGPQSTPLSFWLSTFGVGLAPVAPGTAGSALALLLGYLLHGIGGFILLALATLALYGAGLWAVRRETAGLSDHDPSRIVVDEVVGQWIALWPLSLGLTHAGVDPWVFPYPGWIGAFVMFRLFDIWKPLWVGRMDRRGDAAGVMLDDVVAGLMAAVVVALMAAVAHGLMGA